MNNNNYQERIDRAETLFKQGYNCAQSVVIPFADLHGLNHDIASKVASSFGGGIGRMRETCGAACGMFLLAGLETGATSADDTAAKAENYRLVQDLAKKFAQENGSLNCAELLGLDNKNSESKNSELHKRECNKRPCSMMVRSAAELWANYLASNEK